MKKFQITYSRPGRAPVTEEVAAARSPDATAIIKAKYPGARIEAVLTKNVGQRIRAL